MKKLLNTLFVQSQGVYLHLQGETVVAEKDHAVVLRLPIHTLQGIVCFGNVLCSPFLLGLCGERGVYVSFLTEHGQFLARCTGKTTGNVHLRVDQMRAADDPERARSVAVSFAAGKILNSRAVLMRRIRDHGESAACENVCCRLTDCVKRLVSTENVNSVRGIEGEAANGYFSAFNELLVAQRDAFMIENRNRRPPLDFMNALLSFLYTLLAHDCVGALEGVGLDPQVGFLHALRSGRPSLALDLMEEFRSPIVDRLAVSLVNLKQINQGDFKRTETGAVILSDCARKAVLVAWQKKKQDEVLHPFLEERVSVGLLPHVQALLLARHLRGDLDAYPPYVMK